MLHVVYVLSCNDSGYYPEQCLMSLHTLRKHNPDIPAYVVTDGNTRDILAGNRMDSLARYAEILTFDVPSEFNSARLSSRYLKTSLRHLVSGDFIFMDCDTLVCRPFSVRDHLSAPIGMVADLNAPLPLSDPETLEKCRKAGFPDLQGAPYFNSGVIFVKDTPLAFRFYETWHQLWRESVQRGCPYDQPSLCEANKRLGFPIQALSGAWNCQIKFKDSLRFLEEAFVLHYFAADGSSIFSVHEEALLKKVKTDGVDLVTERILCSGPAALTAFFSQKTDAALSFLASNLFSVYSEDRSTFRFAERLAVSLRKAKRAVRKFIPAK